MENPISDLAIRRATPDDAVILSKLGAATFTETFGHLYTAEDLQTFLAESHSRDAWSQKLADPAVGIWIAELRDEPIGFVAVGPCKLPVDNLEPRAGEIHQLYVLKTHQNLKIGALLIDIGLEWLRKQGHEPLYIGVWSENEGAQRFYGRYGFEKFGEYGFPVGDTVDREFILKR